MLAVAVHNFEHGGNLIAFAFGQFGPPDIEYQHEPVKRAIIPGFYFFPTIQADMSVP